MLYRENVYSNSDPNKSTFNPHDGYALRWQTPIKIFPNGNSAAMAGVMHLVSEAEIKILADYISKLKP